MRALCKSILFVFLLAAMPLSAQSSGAIDCSVGGQNAACKVQLRPHHTVAHVLFRPSMRLLVDSVKIQYLVAELPGGVARPAERDPSARDTYIATWSGAAPPTDTVRLLVQTLSFGALQSDTIVLVPPSRARADSVEAPYMSPYIWLEDDWIPTTISVNVTAIDGSPMTQERCERVRFAFQPRGGGKVEPDTGNARYEPNLHTANGKCYAETRWKLGEATGTQQLHLVLGDGETVARSDQIVRAYARALPRVVAGLGYFTRHNSKEDRFCQAGAADSLCVTDKTTADTIKRQVPREERNETEPYFGVEFPVFFSYQPGSGFTRQLYERVRLVVGTTFIEPRENFFIGAAVIPVMSPASEGFPVQLHAAWRPTEGGFMLGIAVDGTNFITNALKVMGAPF